MIVSHALASITYLLIITSFYFILKQIPVPPFLNCLQLPTVVESERSDASYLNDSDMRRDKHLALYFVFVTRQHTYHAFGNKYRNILTIGLSQIDREQFHFIFILEIFLNGRAPQCNIFPDIVV